MTLKPLTREALAILAHPAGPTILKLAAQEIRALRRALDALIPAHCNTWCDPLKHHHHRDCLAARRARGIAE